MAHLQSITVLYLLMFALGTAVSANEQESARTDLRVVIPSNGVNGCPSDEDRQAARQLLQSITDQVLRNYSINSNCGPGLWRQVYYLNASNEDQSCPGDWNSHTHQSVRGCGGADTSCRSAFSDEISISYNKVCGRLIGIGVDKPDAFYYRINSITVEDNYLDGVSVTHGAPGSRTHIWSFAAGYPPHVPRCPCDNTDRSVAPLPPPQVGENYFCSRSTSRRLWTGDSCTPDNPCCSFHNPPYFSVQLPTPTTDQIELRICADEALEREAVLVLFAEIYVQ